MVDLERLFGKLRSPTAMDEITWERIQQMRKLEPRRRCFANHSGIQMAKRNGSKSFSVKFEETIRPIYEAMTGYQLHHNVKYNNYWHYIDDDEDLTKIQQWESSQGDRVFLRDCLSLSIALGINFPDNQSHERTELGELEHRAKKHGDKNAIKDLASRAITTIGELPFYRDADFVAAVPPRPDKGFDLPTAIAKLVAVRTEKRDITPDFKFGNTKGSLKELALDEKWAAWQNAALTVDNVELTDSKIILIDDKYQSGTTIQFVAMILQSHGASEVYGLSLVKTLRDSDNR
jgi:phosphoribosylpyrophosphate synthetase